MSSDTAVARSADTGAGELARDLAAASLSMARRFQAGATLWCVSPSWPHHARHVAVEFVHPVIVGKPALPSLIGPSEDPVAGLRVSVDPGDLVLAIGDVDEPSVAELMQRAHAWGVETFWVGSGPRRPPPGAADHVLWLDEQEGEAAYDGRFILLYHLLWELTHVCLEHRGRLQAPAPVCVGEVCVTCSDEGVLAEVVGVDGLEARVRTAEGPRTVDVTLVGEVAPDDLLLVHAGSAIARVDSPTAVAGGPV
jgi:hydrogenase maturation factor